MTIHELAQLIGLDGPKINAATLRRHEGLYLVNSTLDRSRLKRYYTPGALRETVLEA